MPQQVLQHSGGMMESRTALRALGTNPCQRRPVGLPGLHRIKGLGTLHSGFFEDPCAHQPRAMSRGGRLTLNAVAVTAQRTGANDNERRVFALPLDYYRVLKARRINSQEILRRNYQNLSQNPPKVGYSEPTLRSRAMILKLASDCLLESEMRREYDQRIASGVAHTIEVRVSDFPGALALLQECGEMAKVVEYGSQWLTSNTSNPASRDVGLTMALAYCDLASETLSEGEGVARCCEELETAVELLSHFDVADHLLTDIQGTLKELRPQYTLEQLALPAEPANAEKKARALAQLKALVWEVDPDVGLSPFLDDREGFLQQARPHLSAVQQIELYECAPRGVAIPLGEVYDAALAYVAEGYRAKWPQHIFKASKALQKIQVAAMSGDGMEAMDVSVEMGLCALMMGETDRAMNYLGLADNANKLPEESVLLFVKENSPSEDDLLPGVCALAERWLKETIIPNYKEMTVMQSSLGEWFQSKKVSVYLQVLERGKELNLLSATSATMKLSSSVAKGITSAVSRSVSGIKGIFIPSRSEHGAPGEEDPATKAELQKIPIPDAPIEDTIELGDMEELRRLNSLNGSAPPSTSNSNGAAPPVSGKGKEVLSQVSRVLEGDMSVGGLSWDEEDKREGEEKSTGEEASESNGENHANANGVENHVKDVETGKDLVEPAALSHVNSNGAEDYWEAPGNDLYPAEEQEPSKIMQAKKELPFWKAAWFKAVAAGGLVLCAALMGSIWSNQRSYPHDSGAPGPISRVADAVSDLFVDTQGTLDVPLAENLVQRWHGVKSEALGASHNTELLAEILEGRMLRQWKDRAQYVKQDGWWVNRVYRPKTWHWQYKLLNLSVDKVSVARDGKRATIEAQIQERAELIDNGRKADWYSTSYSVQYELVMRKNGWKISSARVIYES
ncbi:hypothetical protein BSKO_12727 [Bryopsis sp. KO-2023]|nr:hypothetical protein BSKO_12727 [Bryopsis sp. KO-2023]